MNAPTAVSSPKPSARRLLVELNRETKLAVFDGRSFILRPAPENPWEFKIDANNCADADALAGWVQYLLSMSWAHPVMIRQFVRVVCHIFTIDLATAAERGLDY